MPGGRSERLISSTSQVSFPQISSTQTIWESWRQHAERVPGGEAIVHWRALGTPVRWTWRKLTEAASSFSSGLRDAGVRSGDVCGLILRHNPNFYPLYLGVSSLGAIPSVLAYPNRRLHPDKFRAGLEGMARTSGLDWILTEKELAPTLDPVLRLPGSTIRGLLLPLERSEDISRATDIAAGVANAGDPCLLQHSSGTTGLQKAVVLSHRAVLEHAQRYGRVLQLSQNDRVVSWLPLYHDMGLIAAFYLPLIHGVPLVQLDPFEWVSAPTLLLDAISNERATLCWLPNFAYNLMADRARDEDLKGVNLESLRMLVNCSEPVRAESHERFARRFEPYGLNRDALTACYAMAEATFAVAQTEPGRQARTLRVSRDSIGAARAELVNDEASGRDCVSSGHPIPGCEVRVVNESGERLPERSIGEIEIRSVSLFDGYRNQPEKTAAVLRDGWYLTGDLGFLDVGEIFVVGRKKDIIVVAGKNLYPEDIEDALGQVAGLLPGRIVAFSIDDDRSGTEQVCVVAETPAEDDAEKKKVRRAAVEAAMSIDVTLSRVYLAPPRWLIKSSSGKPSRHANRDRALAELEFGARRAE